MFEYSTHFKTITQCKISWNSCQDLGFSRKFPLPLETLDKILNYLGPLKYLEILDKNLAKIHVKKSGMWKLYVESLW